MEKTYKVINNQYRLFEPIHEDNGVKFCLGVDLATNVPIAAKLYDKSILTKYDIDRVCFEKEYEVFGKFDHENILNSIYCGSFEDGFCNIGPKLENGYLLNNYLEIHKSIELPNALSIIRQLSSALSYAHERDIIHKNIKPSSIVVFDNPDGSVTAYLFEFGMSYIIDYSSYAKNRINENFGYLSPEATGLLDKKVSVESDLYSLGAVMYQILTGTPPFTSGSIDNMIYQHVAVVPADPSEINTSIPQDVSSIILKLLNKDPDLRYRSADELIKDIDIFLSGQKNTSSNREYINLLNSKARYSGRTKELKQLSALAGGLVQTGGQLCVISGDPGAGKSDLLLSFQNHLRSQNIHVLNGRFLKSGADSPYSAFQEILDFYQCIFAEYDPKTQYHERQRLLNLLSGHSQIVYNINPDMRSVLLDDSPLVQFDSLRDQQRTLHTLASLFLNLFDDNTPYVLCFDDIQFAGSAGLMLLIEIARSLAKKKILIVCSYVHNAAGEDSSKYTSVLIELRNNGIDYTEIKLHPFTESQLASYISTLLRLRREDCKLLATYVMDKTAGNPYFTVNVLRSLLEEDQIRINNGVLTENWSKLNSSSQDAVDLQQIILRRIERLSEETVGMLEAAATIGSDFSLPLLCEALGLPKPELLKLLNEAEASQFIEHLDKDNYCFSHAQLYEAFLNHPDAKTKKKLHLAIADATKKLHAELSSSDVFRLVYHYTEAGDEKELQKYIFRCAENAERANAVSDAISYYERALDLLKKNNQETGEAAVKTLNALIDLYMVKGMYDKSIAYADSLRNILKDPIETADLLCRIGTGYYRKGLFDKCEDILIESLRILKSPLPSGRTTIHTYNCVIGGFSAIAHKLSPSKKSDVIAVCSPKYLVLSKIYTLLSKLYIYHDNARFSYIASHFYYVGMRKFGNTREISRAFTCFGRHLLEVSEFTRSEDYLRTALNICRDDRDEVGISYNLLYLGDLYRTKGLVKQSIKFIDEALSLAEKSGDVWMINTCLRSKILSTLLMGEYKKVINLCERSISISKSIVSHFDLCYAYCLLAKSCNELGDHNRAEEYCTLAQEFLDEDTPFTEFLLCSTFAELKLSTRKYKEALPLIERAYTLYRENDFPAEYSASVYSFYALTLLYIFHDEADNLPKAEVLTRYKKISSLANEGVKASRKNPNHLILAKCIMAQVLYEGGNIKKADRFFKEALAVENCTENRFIFAYTHYMYSFFLSEQHRADEAKYHLFEAYLTFTAINAVELEKLCEQQITSRYQDVFGDNLLLADVSARRNRLNVDRKVNTLLRLGERLTSTIELEELQNKILQDAVELVGAERGILFLYPENGDQKLYVASIYNLGSNDFNTYDWILEEVVRTTQPVVINDLQSLDHRKNYPVMARYGVKSVMAMPMYVRGKLFGVIYLDSRLTKGIFTVEYMETLGFIANQCGAPIENARLYRRAITDALTGVYGRSYLDNLLVDKISYGQNNKTLSALMIDIDFFKKCNDTYGHPFGDKVLKQVSSTIKRVVGNLGTVCRYGGEEFVAILDTNDSKIVMAVAEHLRQSVEAAVTSFNDNLEIKPVKVTISIGAAIFEDGMERVELIENADKALYTAKQTGRNRVVLYNR